MVAKTTIEQRFAPTPEPLIAGRWLVPKLTHADAMAMVRIGIIPEDASTELLNGIIVLKDRAAEGQDTSMIGGDHRTCVERLSDLRGQINDARRHVESQQPLVCSETHVPEPDFMVLRGTLADYTSLPTAHDAFCVVEVADSSYERDAGHKLRHYALAGIAQYVIVNLRSRTAEVYANPDAAAGTYPPPRMLAEGESLDLRVGDDERFAVRLADVLP